MTYPNTLFITFDWNSGIELDDLFPGTEGDINEDLEPEILSHKLMDGDKEYLESALVVALRPDHWKRLAVRLFQMQGKMLKSLYSVSRSSIDLGSSTNTNELCAKDLIAFIVQSGNKFCLAVMEVVGFRFKKEKSIKLTMAVEQLSNGKNEFKVNGQIIKLAPSSSVAEVQFSPVQTPFCLNLNLNLVQIF